MQQEDFCKFLQNIGVRQETGVKLWEGNIRSPQELASVETVKLMELVDDSLLINTLYPILNKFAFPITMAPDPCKKAIALLKKHACTDNEDMDVDPPQVADGVHSDSHPISMIVDQRGPTIERNPRQNSPGTTPQRPTAPSTNVFDTPQRTNVTRTNNQGDKKIFVINGGNFVQANVGGDKPVVYNNTNTTIQAISVVETPEERMQRRKVKLDPSWIKIEDFTFSTSTLRFDEEPEYWPDDNVVTKVGQQDYEMLVTDSNIYPVNPWNSNRALIINVTNFTKADARKGADVDARQLEAVLKQLGFDVTLCLDKRMVEIKQSLKEYQRKVANQHTSMSLVFIGSHGDRELNNDRFLSSDEHRMNVSDVVDSFNGRNCPSLAGKPKLFFYQFCRQDSGAKINPGRLRADRIRQANAVHSDAAEEVQENLIPHAAHKEADMLQVYATAAGTKAYRDVKEGSWFVTALCKTLKKYAHSKDLISMMTRVNGEVKANKNEEHGQVAVQLSEFKSTLSKDVRFYPQ